MKRNKDLGLNSEKKVEIDIRSEEVMEENAHDRSIDCTNEREKSG